MAGSYYRIGIGIDHASGYDSSNTIAGDTSAKICPLNDFFSGHLKRSRRVDDFLSYVVVGAALKRFEILRVDLFFYLGVVIVYAVGFVLIGISIVLNAVFNVAFKPCR